VDAIHCEAVLEHLEFPNEAVAEMFRVLRPGGQLFAATPFMQHFHAYPNHFQNFTVIGHKRLFERAGFEVVSAGVCVGPTYAVFGLLFRYLYTYLSIPVIRQLVAGSAAVIALLLRPLDKRLNQSAQAHLLASTTYAHLVKN
jgi:ubiquinone/menaquinone biosynthesis C-methylase UbiE